DAEDVAAVQMTAADVVAGLVAEHVQIPHTGALVVEQLHAVDQDAVVQLGGSGGGLGQEDLPLAFHQAVQLHDVAVLDGGVGGTILVPEGDQHGLNAGGHHLVRPQNCVSHIRFSFSRS